MYQALERWELMEVVAKKMVENRKGRILGW